mgnify:CR=1 FL=1
MTTRYFRGFSTIPSRKSRERIYYDLDLIKFDLLNHFNTHIGERVMRPDWGCRIWDWLMDPMTSLLKNQIILEARRICEADTRLNILEVQVVDSDHAIRVEIVLEFVPLKVVDTFAVDFERRENARWNTGG